MPQTAGIETFIPRAPKTERVDSKSYGLMVLCRSLKYSDFDFENEADIVSVRPIIKNIGTCIYDSWKNYPKEFEFDAVQVGSVVFLDGQGAEDAPAKEASS